MSTLPHSRKGRTEDENPTFYLWSSLSRDESRIEKVEREKVFPVPSVSSTEFGFFQK